MAKFAGPTSPHSEGNAAIVRSRARFKGRLKPKHDQTLIPGQRLPQVRDQILHFILCQFCSPRHFLRGMQVGDNAFQVACPAVVQEPYFAIKPKK